MSDGPADAVRRLLVQHLGLPDRQKLVAFLRLGRARLGREWRLVDRGDAEVLMLGADEPDTVPGLLNEPALTIRLVDASHVPAYPSRDLLIRPIQYEDFVSQLEAYETSSLSRAGLPSQGGQASGPVEGGHLSAGRVDAAAGGIDGGQASSILGATRPGESADGSAAIRRYRLRRWPSAALLQTHRYHARLASFLSVRPLTLNELLRYSNVDRASCVAFFESLREEGLLDETVSAARPPRSNRGSADPAVATDDASSQTSTQVTAAKGGGSSPVPPVVPAPAGLLSRLRRTLGLETSR